MEHSISNIRFMIVYTVSNSKATTKTIWSKIEYFCNTGMSDDIYNNHVLRFWSMNCEFVFHEYSVVTSLSMCKHDIPPQKKKKKTPLGNINSSRHLNIIRKTANFQYVPPPGNGTPTYQVWVHKMWFRGYQMHIPMKI